MTFILEKVVNNLYRMTKTITDMFAMFLVILVLAAKECISQEEEEDEPYFGKFIGKFNSYHHQVSGSVYAVDDSTLLLHDFNYDGTGDDVYFWAGDNGRPGPQGFLVPDEHGKTNVLERYSGAHIRLRLPSGKSVSRLRWLALLDVSRTAPAADVLFPDGLSAPAPVRLASLSGPGVTSEPLEVLDHYTVLIPSLRVRTDPDRSLYFRAGHGPQPSARSDTIPDEYGYYEPLPSYNDTDVRLSLPVTKYRWLSVWDVTSQRSVAHVTLPAELNVPVSGMTEVNYVSPLPHCRQLHRTLQVSWEVFGVQLTIQLVGQISPQQYMSVGVSGSRDHTRMLGSDVTVVTYDEVTSRAAAVDYNITDLAQCVQVLGSWRGVCPDSILGKQDSAQVLTAGVVNGLTHITFRRQLVPVEDIDLEWPLDRKVPIVWAIGPLNSEGHAGYHTAYPRSDVMLNLTADVRENDCVPFISEWRPPTVPGDRVELGESTGRVFRVTVGPPRPGEPAPLAWYVEGRRAPDLVLRRGLTYTFMVAGGDSPHSARYYHPLVVTRDLRGVLDGGSVLAGAVVSRRQRLAPTAAGGLCLSPLPVDPRRAASRAPPSCAGQAASLTVSPDVSWPDMVYYRSYTDRDMNGRIFIVDKFRRGSKRSGVNALFGGSQMTIVAVIVVWGVNWR